MFYSTAVSAQDPQYYALLTSALNAEQTKALNELLVMAEQKKAQYASKKIERQGGKCSIPMKT